jgi:hypothetical protein
MRHAHTELASADADGLTRAHRLWFGLAIESAPLWRPDLQPAGFIAASAEDLARFEAAEIAGGSFEGARVLSAEGIAETQRGAVATGSAENGAYGLGWVEMQVGGVRTIAHSGSTTDMAGIEMFAPERGLGIVVLLNGQSTLYERFHKADLIATAAWQQLLGQEATGTIAFFYPAFDVLAALLIAFTSWRLLGLVRRVRRGEPIRPLLLSSRWLGIFVMVWLNGIIPAEILLRLPEVLAAPWAVLVRLDIGLVAFAFAILRLLFGLVLVAVWTRGFVAARRMRPHASAAGASRVG